MRYQPRHLCTFSYAYQCRMNLRIAVHHTLEVLSVDIVACEVGVRQSNDEPVICRAVSIVPHTTESDPPASNLATSVTALSIASTAMRALRPLFPGMKGSCTYL